MNEPGRREIEAALAGGREAARALATALLPVIQRRVARALFRRGGKGGRDPRQELADLTQEVFAALFADSGRALRSWDETRGVPLGAFVALIADREVASILRSGKRSPWTEEPTSDDDLSAVQVDAASPVDEVIGSRDLLGKVLARIEAQLSPQGLLLFHAIYVEELSVEETCARSGLSADAVYAWRSRLAKQLRALAQEVLSDSSTSPRIPPRGPIDDR